MWYRTLSVLFLMFFAISPVWAVDPNEVVLCEHQGGGGTCYSFKLEPYMRHLLVPTLGEFGDKASSAYIGSGVVVELFDHSQFVETSILGSVRLGDRRGDDGNYVVNFDHLNKIRENQEWSDRISSLVITRHIFQSPSCHPMSGGQGVRLSHDPANLLSTLDHQTFYLPESLYVHEARYPRISGKVQDKADLALLLYASHSEQYQCIQYEAELYEHANLMGKSLTLPLPHSGDKNVKLGTQGMQDVVSSVAVRMKDWPQYEVYDITVKTPENGYGTTTSNVFLTLYGQDATVGRLHLKDKNNYRDPETFRFSFDKDIGFIERIEIAHDLSGEKPSMCMVEEVRVRHLKTGEEWVFPLNDFIGACLRDRAGMGVNKHIIHRGKNFVASKIIKSAMPPPPMREPGIVGTDGTRHRAPSAKPPVAAPQDTMPQATSPVVPKAGTVKMQPIAKAPIGAVAPIGATGNFLDNRDFPGNDLPNMPIVYTKDGSPDRCAQDCATNTNCAAFTYVKPGPEGVSLCWLKWPVPDEAQRTWQANNKTVSGTRPTVGQQKPATPSAPAAPPVTPTAPPAPASPPSMPAVGPQTANFDTGLDSRWQILRQGMQVQNGMLTCDGGPSGTLWDVAPTANFTLNFRYRHGTGIGAVVLNYDEAQPLMQYRVWLLSDRAQIVRRSGTPDLNVVAESDMNQPLALVPGHMYSVTITANAGQIGVAIDGRTQLTYTDSQPLPPGGLVFGCGEGTGFAYDDIEIN